ncbi:phosphoinositide 3-kinase regulatory subunit 4 [Trichonephila clavipes]|nr:phosphoinositide 3-kinase regulatory subunit 4 [Trichonephila clavipes]
MGPGKRSKHSADFKIKMIPFAKENGNRAAARIVTLANQLHIKLYTLVITIMGNQLTAIAPSQIFPVEYYLTDLPDCTFDSNLGSTRFFKVARAKHREGLIVVKVFAIRDPSLPLKAHKDRLEEIKRLLKDVPNTVPFQKFLLTDKAGILIRQYVKDNLYDRISTRPFLNSIEKRWIAFQLLQCLSQCHELGVYHGDIKLENIMVTSWNWVLLTDFASFKPTNLAVDNPADFSYFFDTSRRRTCYIAPERFIKTMSSSNFYSAGTATVSSTSGGSIAPSSPSLIIHADEIKTGDLTDAMDIFSLGCALAELFTEGTCPFDFSQLLKFITGDFDPHDTIEKIEDSDIKRKSLEAFDSIRRSLPSGSRRHMKVSETVNDERHVSFRKPEHPPKREYSHQVPNERTPLRCYGCGKQGVIKSRCPTCNLNASQRTDVATNHINAYTAQTRSPRLT